MAWGLLTAEALICTKVFVIRCAPYNRANERCRRKSIHFIFAIGFHRILVPLVSTASFSRALKRSRAEASCLVASRHEDMRRSSRLAGKGVSESSSLAAKPYEKANFKTRILWTLKTNTRIIIGLWSELWSCNEIRFTGSPPLLLHWIAPLNLLLRKRLVYRITDFHPECLIAARDHPSWWLESRLSLDAVLAAPGNSF